MPVWKRLPVSVANGLCHPWAPDHGSGGSRRYTRMKARISADWGYGISFWICCLFLKDWIPGQASLPRMTHYIAWWTCFWGTFPPSKILLPAFYHHVTTTSRHHESLSGEPFHHFTFPRFYHSTYIYGGVALICITLPGVGLPGVNLIIYKDDLRMMAQKPVAAKEGAMKDIAECTRLFMRLSRN